MYFCIKEKGKFMIRHSLLIVFLLLTSVVTAGKVEKIELKNLDGRWEGSGEFLLPGIHTKMSIDGNAVFTYDAKLKKLRTSLTGEKFMFTYSDSGYLAINPKTDSVSWEIWDNSNKHALYHGIREGNRLRGDRLRGKETYEVLIEQKAEDSIQFKLIIIQDDGDVYDKAVFDLWRVK